MNEIILQAKSLSFSGDSEIKILNQVSISLSRGDFHVLLGPNGAGKSSLIKVLSGLIKIESGSLDFFNRALKDYSTLELAKKRSVLPQENLMVFPVKVREVVALGRSPYGGLALSKNDKEKVDETISLLELDEFADRPINLVSGGEQQRVQIARILCQDTDLIFLDEPLNSLDIKYQLKVMDLLRVLCEKGKTVVCAMHDLNLAFEYASQISLLNKGEVIAQGEPAAMLEGAFLEAAYGVNFEITQTTSGSYQFGFNTGK